MNTRFAVVGLLLSLSTAAPAAAQEAATPSLRAAYQAEFVVGVGLDGRLPDDYGPNELGLVCTQFSALTPANCMKMDHVQPRPGVFRFEQADEFVDFARKNDLSVCGHTLLWAKDERTPAWFFKDGDGKASRDVLLARLKAHIDALAGRYKGQLASWDVVNEALPDGDAVGLFRPSSWLDIIGDDFVAEAFRLAHAADPKAVLVYNDYNIELPAKRAKLIDLLRRLIVAGAPIHAVGIQGHFELDAIPFDELDKTIAAIHELGLKVMLTELDIDVIPRARWWADGGKHQEELKKVDPYRDGCPPDVLERQAAQYARLFTLFRKHADAIDRVSF